MAREIFPSSFECDCRHRSHFFENTIKEIKRLSAKKRQYLLDAEVEEHRIVFYRGQIVEIICPKAKSKDEVIENEA